MPNETAGLLEEQEFNICSLRRILVNFKKLSKSNITVPTLQGRLAKLETLWASTRNLHAQLLRAATSEEKRTLPYFSNDEIAEAEDNYDETVDVLRDTISRLNGDRATDPLSDNSTDTITHAVGDRFSRLPRITLPKFSGKLNEWESFRNMFESLVANNDSLSNTLKLHYLKTSVVGDAAAMICNVKISDANYESAWQTLIDEYEDKHTLVHSHIRAFLSLPTMKAENVNDLRKLRDTVSTSFAALKNLDRPVDKWDDILVYLISEKFSPRTRTEWNLKRSEFAELPSYKDIHEFLTLRIRGLTDPSDASKDAPRDKKDKTRSSVNSVTAIKCVSCSGDHKIAKCEAFLRRTVAQRNEFVRENKLCFNCLQSGHFTQKCRSRFRCNACRRSHHSLLHDPSSASDISERSTDLRAAAKTFVPSRSTATVAAGDASVASVLSTSSTAITSEQKMPSSDTTIPQVLLATAWVDLHTTEGRIFKVRALLDQGSTFSFISESLCQALRTRRQRADLLVKCFGEKYTGSARSRVSLSLSPCARSEPKFPVTPYVFQSITSYAASQTQPRESWPHLRGLSFADPDPSSGHRIHMLIGADLYGSLLRDGLRQGPLGTPTAQKTALGWILSGPTKAGPAMYESTCTCNCVSSYDTHLLLQKFWENEEVSLTPPLTEEEERCERHFLETHGRSPDGRYIVKLPFRQPPPVNIGESLQIATLLYNKMETRLRRHANISGQYNEFLAEYRSLDHMIEVDSREHTEVKPVYIPHHPVLRESSSTTKLRVVFNASCKSSNGTSLNDHLLVGQKLQQDLPAILLRWRQWRYVYTADIAKMFRQILIHPSDVDYQRILWRPSSDEPIAHFRLLTVTYGLASAPYLAMRVLRQLSHDEGSTYPAAVSILNKSVYVDDVLFGADDVELLIEHRIQLTALLDKGGFQLRKWASNSQALLDDLSIHQTEQSDHFLSQDESLKVLGISWIPKSDEFQFVVSLSPPVMTTKRSVLSVIARLYDPLGWAAPVVIVAKILLQELWLLKTDWDTPLPAELERRWTEYYQDLQSLSQVRIPRWIGYRAGDSAYEIHGFADASNRAYAAVVYLRVSRPLLDARVCLLTAKTKVAPLKTLSIPRLELNAIVLLSRLISWTVATMSSIPAAIHAWSDSTIALAWLRQHPSKWKTFVANRVSEVQRNLPSGLWHHVPSRDNPADCASRGLQASELSAHTLWWTGPAWLPKPASSWPDSDQNAPAKQTDAELISTEARESFVHHVECEEWDLVYRFSSWNRLLRVTAYIRRFIARLQKKSKVFRSPLLEVEELHEAEHFWLSYVQRRAFAQEIKSLNRGSNLHSGSPLRALRPFVDAKSLLRLGGRLANAALNYEEQHPIILPRHPISDLLIDKVHKATLHGGAQLVMRTLRQKYWILSCRQAVKARIRRCVRCVRHAALPCTQLMGNLPSPRVNPSPPFEHTGVDYAGPFNVTASVGRGQRTKKAYVALFICLTIKAIHLELVEDCSTDGFLAAFHRFVSRRGTPRYMYRDNGTNFRGADGELQRQFKAAGRDPVLTSALATKGVSWKFIPSAAPHFGGLWEAGVKSFKRHLRRVFGSQTLSQVEFATLLCQIEACLNSRPIVALSDDPQDFSALTPGHFLVGRPLVAAPGESTLEIAVDRLSRWQLVRSMCERLWRSWSHDYLHSLQQRTKWRASAPNLEIGELVLLKNPLLPPSKWELARVHQTHPGTDGLVRVVTVRTARSLLKRPINQLCRLLACNEGSAAESS